MKRQVLITTTLLLMLGGGFTSRSIAASVSLTHASSTALQGLSEEAATPSLSKRSATLKQNAERDRQRQQEAARRERERQRQAEMQERWQDDRNDDDDERRRDRWEESEDYWDDRDSQQEDDRDRWEEERGDRDWQQQQNSRYWEEQQRNWEQQRDWEQRRDWEFRREWQQNNGQQDWQSHNPYSDGTRLELTSLSDDWVTVLIESVDGEQAISFTGDNTQQAVYLPPGAYRLRFRPTLSSYSWRSGYLNVRETDSIRLVFDQNRDLVQVYDDPSAWVSE